MLGERFSEHNPVFSLTIIHPLLEPEPSLFRVDAACFYGAISVSLSLAFGDFMAELVCYT